MSDILQRPFKMSIDIDKDLNNYIKEISEIEDEKILKKDFLSSLIINYIKDNESRGITSEKGENIPVFKTATLILKDDILEKMKIFLKEQNIKSKDFMEDVIKSIRDGKYNNDAKEYFINSYENDFSSRGSFTVKIDVMEYQLFSNYCNKYGFTKNRILEIGIEKYIEENKGKEKPRKQKTKFVLLSIDPGTFEKFKNICKKNKSKIDETIVEVIKEKIYK
ncbi:MAG: hypothetical protein JXR51_08225 [Bacteroidales bacterium]|nr:hypothetical protein [Bacteroidales bacterium]